jgi:hypothetical protein
MMICTEIFSVTSIFAQASSTIGATNESIQSGSGHVRDTYNEKAKGLTNVGDQLATGVMTRDTILNYGVRMLVFMSQASLLVGAIMFIYTGYEYIISVITGGGDPDKKHILNAIYGILIIIFSYAIMRILTRAFLT